MKIVDVMRSRGTTDVVTVQPTQTVTELLSVLAEHGIGAVVVSADGASVDGIVSERDIVRKLNERGAEVLQSPVSEIMTTAVHTCTGEDALEQVAVLMTQQRVRHLPVLRSESLFSIVSIGDVVKFRIEQLQAERDHLVDYINK
ncbi:CBS domain-containing protein [Piscicoccus intestinalis]|uniref:CBS domain-containing protein n=1 Tax=Piscicoccus intestinalis TaxID=746033 RepID=UPI000837FB58|nr:CBS domain-containing protein [Piscicoccus intestinalis]